MNLINLALAFFEGLALILSPCILPILPIILAGSLTGSKKRPLGIIIGFILSFVLFTFFSRKLVEYSGIDLNVVRHFSYAILILFGLTMISTTLTEKFMLATQRLANIGKTLSFVKNNSVDFTSGILFGTFIALVWTPCAGPILATVIVQTIIQQTTWLSFLTLLAFTIGAAGPMFLIAILGRKLIQILGFFRTHAMFIRKCLGIIIILAVGHIIYFDLSKPPPLIDTTVNKPSTQLINGLAIPYLAPPLRGISSWINSPPLELNALHGKVILIDFWTYSCINCLRTLPYLKAWYNKYHDKGLVIIGVHSPEFEFEKNLSNVVTAVGEYGIQYPVALDNQFYSWQAFKNNYWPAHYLIDQKGYVVYRHFGEGDDEITENNIRFLLGLHGTMISEKTPDTSHALLETPETYLGSARANHFASPQPMITNQMSYYSFPKILQPHTWALRGPWIIQSDRIISAGKDAALRINFTARHVYIVMGSTKSTPIHVKLRLNGKPVIEEKGQNVSNSALDVKMNKLYDVILLNHLDQGSLDVMPSAAGLEIYTFTFGS